MDEPRNAIFISHATPEDNAFTMWLGSRLAACGYEVWADMLRLKGGQDWQRELENAIRTKAAKVLLVGTELGIEKQGVRNEIQIASDVGKRISDKEFIIPLRLTNFDAPFLIAHAQYVNFKNSWADGLAELLDLLETTYKVQKSPGSEAAGIERWRGIHLTHAKSLQTVPENLISNWIRITRYPDNIIIYDFKQGISLGMAKAKIRDCPLPVVEFRRGFISFAPFDELQDHFGETLPLLTKAVCPSDEFLENGLPDERIERFDAQNMFSNLIRQCFEEFLKSKKLSAFKMSEHTKAWWGDTELLPTEKIPFDWPNIKKGRRQLTGYSSVREMYWHYGVSAKPRFFPYPHIRLIGRAIFSRDGKTPLDDPQRMFRLRRSATRDWRNAKWRDMLLAFLKWLGNGEEELKVPASEQTHLLLQLPPVVLEAPVSVISDDNTDEEEHQSEEELSAADSHEEFLMHQDQDEVDDAPEQ